MQITRLVTSDIGHCTRKNHPSNVSTSRIMHLGLSMCLLYELEIPSKSFNAQLAEPYQCTAYYIERWMTLWNFQTITTRTKLRLISVPWEALHGLLDVLMEHTDAPHENKVGYVNVEVICDHKGRFIIVDKWPGSAHDSRALGFHGR